MANYATLKAAIQQVVKTNGNEEITGALLQQSLLAMVNSLGGYYQFAGIATPSTNPGTPDQNVFYLASTAGTYSNFGSIVIAENEAAILKYNGTWTKDSSGFATSEKVSKLEDQVGDITRVTSASAGTYPYTFISGETYEITNLSSNPVTISHRETPSGASHDIVSMAGNSTIQYTPTSDGSYLRYGDAVDITICPVSSLTYKIEALSDKESEDRTNIRKNTEDIDNIAPREIVSSGSGYSLYGFVQGKEYYIKSIGSGIVTLSFQKGDGTYQVIGSFYQNEVKKVTAISGAIGLRYGSACDIIIDPNIVENDYTEKVETFFDGTIHTNLSIGQQVDVTTLITANGVHKVIEVSKYDEIYIKATGGTNPKAYCFTDENYNAVLVSTDTNVDKTVIAPCDGYCVVNSFGSDYALSRSTRIKNESIFYDLNAREFSSTSATTFRYHFIKGRKYVITCFSKRAYTTFAIRENPSGTNYNVTNIQGFGGSATITAEIDGNYLRVGDPTVCTVEDYESYSRRVRDIEEKIFNYGADAPAVRFDFADNFINPSSELSGMDFSASDIMEQIYAKFDALVGANSGYMTKVDAASAGEANLTYPSYANLGGSASGSYLATPTYRTYLYKLIDYSANVNGILKKRKLFIVGGNHGNEVASPFALYLFAKELCKGEIGDYFKLRSAFDIYILPCLNGYGMYHNQRCNANNVNINRNFPIALWTLSGDSTNPQGDYTGASAGSEFETQLIIKLAAKYSPDILVDFHNFARQDTQFYTDMSYPRFLPLTHKSLNDCSFAFSKNLPSYFGNKYKLFCNINESAPGHLQSMMQGYMSRWGFEQGLPFSCTMEISQGINYLNGSYAGAIQDDFGPDAFAVGEFTLRNQICRYGGFIVGNTE